MKRRLVKLVVFLLLGAIVNVAVAWGCAAWAPLTLTAQTCIEWIEPADDAWLAAAGWRPPPGTEISALGVVTQARGFGFQAKQLAVIAQNEQNDPMRAVTGFDAVGIISRAGWPLNAVVGGRLTPVGLRVEPDRMIDAIELRARGPANWLILGRDAPLRPNWPGFAINTVFYAGALWLLFAAPFALRCRRRIKRGLCPKCAYPVGASDVCTECGKPLAKHKAQTQKAQMP